MSLGRVPCILVINGPNLNILSIREPSFYGFKTLEQIIDILINQVKKIGIQLQHFQSNCECKLIETIHSAIDRIDFIIINPAAFAHTSIALRDALIGVHIPFIEVHLSNVYSRESFRHSSYLSDKAEGIICGFGAMGYELALSAAVAYLKNQNN
ncbi:3-dehydroquinate dehydratase [Candidatus Photodesmus katoptron]|uniref:3-dehydroquinate dehydratase n=1 Tax=Candidatus Photodesmus katoptron Akat1 TaxID=1236703 RepID=S3EH25_9GAMM|nr:type II 3-dehydroquinate dehydratase [Candidatus Photodesmus katoptron]EPE37478.1 3-dehydroquinate dehydratase, type II [Candidatus Photodesmus katoptron Akat1]KEY90307.1 3-dehydroquinate dehydratase [Candidatus Photodesmus katoptron]